MALERAADPVVVVETMRLERATLLELLEGLEPSEWARPTQCPKWTAKGVALHLLGVDVSLLSRQRDNAPSGLVRFADTHPGLSFFELLNGFNERWVDTASFLSERVIIELLRATGALTADFYATVPTEAVGEPIPWLGPDPAPYWMIAQREYVERWVHHLQIARAVDKPGPAGAPFVVVAVASMMPVIGVRFVSLSAPVGTRLGFMIRDTDHAAWTLARSENSWQIVNGKREELDAELSISLADSAPMFSRCMTSSEINRAVTTTGVTALGQQAAELLAHFLGRPN